ncbi:MAG: hypothetical protein V7677_17620 [Motiliproteus sp.]
MTILSETKLEAKLRWQGAIALQFHDVIEDTRLPLPSDLPIGVTNWVEQMTFSSFAEEKERIWSCAPHIRMLKLYDKTSNLLDSVWMNPDKRLAYVDFTEKLRKDVVQNYGELNITVIALAKIDAIRAELRAGESS